VVYAKIVHSLERPLLRRHVSHSDQRVGRLRWRTLSVADGQPDAKPRTTATLVRRLAWLVTLWYRVDHAVPRCMGRTALGSGASAFLSSMMRSPVQSRVAQLLASVGAIFKRSGRAAILAGFLDLVLCGCGAEPSVTSTEVRSPDGESRAVAETFGWTGPGANWVETRVHIEGGEGLDRWSSEILGVDDDRQSLTMKWLTPKHLLIVLRRDTCYRNDTDYLHFQVAKTLGVDISLRYDDSLLNRNRWDCPHAPKAEGVAPKA
jgi:hypothetical protein